MRANTLFFPELVIGLVNAGEQSGELNTVLDGLVKYYTQQKELKGYIIKALIYPLFLIFTAICVLIFFLLYVLPALASTYEAMQAKPSESLQFIIKISNTIKLYYPLIIAALCAVGLYIYQNIALLATKLTKLKGCRELYTLHLEIRFCRLLALLLNSGINITEAVKIASSTITDKSINAKLELFRGYLQKGVDISVAVEHSLGLFSPLTEELIAIGALAGDLPKMLTEAATMSENDFRERLDQLRELLAPTLLIMAAVLIAGIVFTVLAPLFDLFTAIPEY